MSMVCDGSWHTVQIISHPDTNHYRLMLDGIQIFAEPSNPSAKITTAGPLSGRGSLTSFNPPPEWFKVNDEKLRNQILLVGGYWNHRQDRVQSNFRGCMKDFRIHSNQTWRWKTQRMMTTDSCPEPEFQ